MKLWILEVDSTGRPRPFLVVYDGPTIDAIPGDGINAVPIRFELDPPAVLPYRGKFGFFVQNRCEWFFDLLIQDDPTSYPLGETWRSEIANHHVGCPLRGISDRFDVDLCFKIEYCTDTTTTARRRSWGQLKQIYR